MQRRYAISAPEYTSEEEQLLSRLAPYGVTPDFIMHHLVFELCSNPKSVVWNILDNFGEYIADVIDDMSFNGDVPKLSNEEIMGLVQDAVTICDLTVGQCGDVLRNIAHEAMTRPGANLEMWDIDNTTFKRDFVVVIEDGIPTPSSG